MDPFIRNYTASIVKTNIVKNINEYNQLNNNSMDLRIFQTNIRSIDKNLDEPARWLSANVLGLRSRGPGFESWLGYGCLVTFFMCYRNGSSGLDAVV